MACSLLGLSAPVALLDRLNLRFAQPEIMAKLVNDGLGDRPNDLIFIFTFALDRPLEDRNPIGQTIPVAELTFRERRPLIEPEKRVIRVDLQIFQQVGRRLVLDDNGEVLHADAKAPGNALDGLLDEYFEALACHRRTAAFAARAELVVFTRNLVARPD